MENLAASRVELRCFVTLSPIVLMEVANASCGGFWIEFEFGRWLLPKIDDSLEILDPGYYRSGGSMLWAGVTL